MALGEENDRSYSRRKLRVAAGLSGERTFFAWGCVKSSGSQEMTARFFPSSTISKFAVVNPRTGFPDRSTTVTGTSTTLTVTLSFTWATRGRARRRARRTTGLRIGEMVRQCRCLEASRSAPVRRILRSFASSG